MSRAVKLEAVKSSRLSSKHVVRLLYEERTLGADHAKAEGAAERVSDVLASQIRACSSTMFCRALSDDDTECCGYGC